MGVPRPPASAAVPCLAHRPQHPGLRLQLQINPLPAAPEPILRPRRILRRAVRPGCRSRRGRWRMWRFARSRDSDQFHDIYFFRMYLFYLGYFGDSEQNRYATHDYLLWLSQLHCSASDGALGLTQCCPLSFFFFFSLPAHGLRQVFQGWYPSDQSAASWPIMYIPAGRKFPMCIIRDAWFSWNANPMRPSLYVHDTFCRL